MFSLSLPHPHAKNESPQPMSLCFNWKSLLCCKLVSDDLLVCWNHTRERETDVEIWELGELETEQQKKSEEMEGLSTCRSAAAQFTCQVSLCSGPEGRRNTENMSGCQTDLWQTLQFVTLQMCQSFLEWCKWLISRPNLQMFFKTQTDKKNVLSKDLPKVIIICTLFDSKKCNFVWNWMSFVFVFCCFWMSVT